MHYAVFFLRLFFGGGDYTAHLEVQVIHLFTVIHALTNFNDRFPFSSSHRYCIDFDQNCNGAKDPFGHHRGDLPGTDAHFDIADMTSNAECFRSCLQHPVGNYGDMFGDSVACRKTHVRAAKLVTTPGDPSHRWHCTQARLDGNARPTSGPTCADGGCSCTDECADEVGNETETVFPTAATHCAGGADASCAGQLHDIASWLTSNFTSFEMSRLSFSRILPSSTQAQFLRDHIMPRIDNASCELWSQRFNDAGCYCTASNSTYLHDQFGESLAGTIRIVAEDVIPGVCGHGSPKFEGCATPRPPQVEVAKCLDDVPSLAICALDTATNACCSLLAKLDAMGCFCDTSITVVRGLVEEFDGVLQRRDRCLAPESRYETNYQCPRPTFDSCSTETGEPQEALNSRRLRTSLDIGTLFTDQATHFNQVEVLATMWRVFTATAKVDVQDLGTYTGPDRILEYFAIALDSLGGSNLVRTSTRTLVVPTRSP